MNERTVRNEQRTALSPPFFLFFLNQEGPKKFCFIKATAIFFLLPLVSSLCYRRRGPAGSFFFPFTRDIVLLF